MTTDFRITWKKSAAKELRSLETVIQHRCIPDASTDDSIRDYHQTTIRVGHLKSGTIDEYLSRFHPRCDDEKESSSLCYHLFWFPGSPRISIRVGVVWGPLYFSPADAFLTHGRNRARLRAMSSTPSVFTLDAARVAAREAATTAGKLIAQRLGESHVVDEMHAHDIKLAVDRESQEMISGVLLRSFPDHGILGEEGAAGDPASDYQWIVDPIDGTVNYFYGIPHFGVSVALRWRGQVIVGVIFDPMVNELWEVAEGDRPLCNGKPIQVSARGDLSQAVVSMGFAKRSGALQYSIRRYERVAPAVRKIRMLGSAALEMAYVASGRLDAYIEEQVSIWDIAAGRLLVERAGGTVILTPHADRGDRFSIVCTNGLVPIENLLS